MIYNSTKTFIGMQVKLYLGIALLFILSTELHAQQSNQILNTIPLETEPVSIKDLLHESDSLNTDSLILFMDDVHLTTTGTSFVDLYYVVRIQLYSKVNVNVQVLPNSLSLEASIEMNGDAVGGGAFQFQETKTLQLSPRKDISSAVYHLGSNNPAPHQIKILKSVRVAILKSQLDSISSELYLEGLYAGIKVERARYFQPMDITIEPEFFESNFSDTANHLKGNEAIAQWNEVEQPSNYEVEWVHIPYNSTSGVSSIQYKFNENAVRLLTNNNFVPINKIHNNGFIVVRGRTKRPILNKAENGITNEFQFSEWNLDDEGTINTSSSFVLEINNDSLDEERRVNWTYGSNYSNNGKKKESLNFFDGSSRNRQSNTIVYNNDVNTSISPTNTVNNSTTVISKEEYYDFNGQPLISILPTPLILSKNIGYQKGINKITATKIYKNEYDSINGPASLSLTNDSVGASQYYSVKNQLLLSNTEAQYIPDAGGFPYQRTEYMTDGSGRIKAVYGIGEIKANDVTKGTQYVYVKPGRTEVERVLGSNVGDINYYKKDIVIDPNGVMNISYKDFKDRVVASSISGVAEGRSDMVAIPFNAVPVSEDLLASGAEEFIEIEDAYELSYPIYVPATSTYTFDYGFDVDPYLPCVNNPICYDCRYKLTFQVFDEKNEVVFSVIDSLVDFNQSSCLEESYQMDLITYLNSNYSASIDQITGELSITLSGRKQYSIYKRLELLKDSLEEDAEAFLQSGKCGIKSYIEFENEELDKLNFDQCEDNFSHAEKTFCSNIYEGMVEDFMFPNGYFFRGLNGDEDPFEMLSALYDSLNKTVSCNRFGLDGCFGDKLSFIDEILNGSRLYNINSLASAPYQIRRAIAVELVKYHPNYCKYEICLKKYENYTPFDIILEKSENLEDFVAMAEKQQFFSTDSLTFLWDTTSLTYMAINLNAGDTLKTEEIFSFYDPVIGYDAASVRDTLEYYELCSIEDGGVAFYSLKMFNNFVRESCNPKIDTFDRADIYNIYFTYLSTQGCAPDTFPGDTGIPLNLYQMVRAVAEFELLAPEEDQNDYKWNTFKSYYLQTRDLIMEDMLSSILCVNPNYYRFDQDCSVKTDTSHQMYGEEDLIDTGCVSINLSCLSDLETHFWNTDYYGPKPFRVQHASTFASLDTMSKRNDTLVIDTSIAKQVYALLKADSCVEMVDTTLRVSDSIYFVNNFSATSFACDPFGHISSYFGNKLKCELKRINLASIQTDLIKLKRDSANTLVTRFVCDPPFQKDYTYQELLTRHDSFVASLNDTLPIVTSIDQLDISNPLQKKYANVMNASLGLSLGFADYYTFIQDNTPEDSINDFGDTVNWHGSARVKQLKEVITENAENVRYNELQEDSLFNLVNKYLIAKSYDTLNRTEDYLGLGELGYSNGQNDIYFFEDGRTQYASLLDTFNLILYKIHEYFSIIEESPKGETVGTELFLDQYGDIPGLDSLLIDRAVCYANGTVWLRTLNSSDSTYFKDYYFYYEPFTYFYDLADIDTFRTISPVFDEEQMNYAKLGFTFKSRDYQIVVSTSAQLGEASRLAKILLTNSVSAPNYPIQESCEDLLYDYALIRAKTRYLEYIDGIKDVFKLEYTNFCMNKTTSSEAEKALSNRTLTMSYELPERQYTLYYYDQADNLVMTVPPSGVDTAFVSGYDSSVKTKIDDYRSGSGSRVFPRHKKVTTYKYNSNNQIIQQETPNGGISLFWYDKAGRLVLSQNAEQENTNKYSYTFYDKQSRIEETGETTINEFSDKSWGEIHAQIVLGKFDSTSVSLEDTLKVRPRTYVSKTFYDENVLPSNTYGFTQENLRSRVATQAYYASLDTNNTALDWDYATHYSYDATGNVKTLLNDYYQDGTIDNEYQRFKRIDYAFDVISGNVLQVYYQMGYDDAFYHRYEYDAENRITKVETSTDGIIWDEDANYDYYLHGPLARTELGEHKVQGIDYSYTLDGWLKAVNSGHHEADMGNDLSKSSVFAEDAFGFALNYHQNDYQSIGSVNAMLIGAQDDTLRSDLYNGNIASITKHNQTRTIGTSYQYDQLNRLKTMGEEAVNTDSLTWENGLLSDGNFSFYEYDKSGNLTSLQRLDGASGQMMDQLSYNYINGKDQLSSVNDTVQADLFPHDIDNQSTGNYSYDEIGNLVADSAEGICHIQWYPNGKVKKIRRDYPTRERSDLYFEYDALGNRVKKVVSFEEDERTFRRANYYVRDAQGNVMATYEERDCDYYEANDSTGEFYYQYGETFGYYTQLAIDQTSRDTVLTFLEDDFSKAPELLEQAYLNLHFISGIRDSIFLDLDDSTYLSLYPQANQRVLGVNAFTYAEHLFENDSSYFAQTTNYKNEAYINYLIQNDEIDDFYNEINSIFASHADSADIEDFLIMNRSLASVKLSDESFMLDYFRLTKDGSKDEYAELKLTLKYPSTIATDLNAWLTNIETDLLNTDDKLDDLAKSNALMILHEFTTTELATAFSGIDLTAFYGAQSWLPAPKAAKITALLHHAHIYHPTFIDFSALDTYKPTTIIKWALDIPTGDLLPYHLQTDVSTPVVVDLMVRYFDSVNVVIPSTYFIGDTAVYPFVQNSMEYHWNDAKIKTAILAFDSLTKAHLYQTEDLAYLTNYFKLYHPSKTILQNYYYDSLSIALSGLAHMTPYDYANELSAQLGVSFGPVGGCSPHVVYLLPEQYTLYGSSRLGVMDAKKRRKDGENQYSRKLGAKNYELSDHLGNVVATISDKKLHPLELLINGNYNVDTTIGFQAEVTGRYDYYPFGMEIMDRSGDFNEVDYTQDVIIPEYEGLLTDCSDYFFASGTTANRVSGTDGITVTCTSDTNIFGQPYISSYLVEDSLIDQLVIQFYASLSELIPNLDTTAEYQIEIHVEQVAGRKVAARVLSGPTILYFNGLSVSMGLDLPFNQVWASPDRVIIVTASGAELQEMTYTNGDIKFHINTIPIHTWRPEFTQNLEIVKIKANRVLKGSEVQLAKRERNAYPYGFQGHLRNDELSGSGNSIDMGDRWLDTRLGKTLKPDRQASSYPWISPYSFAANNPILFIDPDGERIRWFASKGVLKYRKALLSTPTGREVWRNMRKSATKITVQVTDKVLVVEAGDRLFVTEGVTYNAGNLNNDGGEFSYDEATVYVSLGTQKLKKAVAANAGADKFEDLTFKQKAEGIRSEIGTGNYDVYNADSESSVESDAYGTVSIANDPYGGEIDVAEPLNNESEGEYTGRVGGHEGVHSYKDAKIEGSQQRYSRGTRQLNKEKAAYDKERGIINEQRSNRRNK